MRKPLIVSTASTHVNARRSSAVPVSFLLIALYHQHIRMKQLLASNSAGLVQGMKYEAVTWSFFLSPTSCAAFEASLQCKASPTHITSEVLAFYCDLYIFCSYIRCNIPESLFDYLISSVHMQLSMTDQLTDEYSVLHYHHFIWNPNKYSFEQMGYKIMEFKWERFRKIHLHVHDIMGSNKHITGSQYEQKHNDF